MDLGRQRRRVALYRWGMLERLWMLSWPGPFPKDYECDGERPALKTGEPTRDFTLVEPRLGPYPLSDEVLTFAEAARAIAAIYDRSSAVQSLESDPPKKKRKLLVIPSATIPQDRPKTVLSEKRAGFVDGKSKTGKVRGWVATDLAWRTIRGTGKTRWSAEHSLRVQVAAVAWRRMGGKISHRPGSPLPCTLTKLGKVWTASSWREDREAEFGVGLTVEDALAALVRVRGETPKLRVLGEVAIEWRDEASFRSFEKHASGWYGPDPT